MRVLKTEDCFYVGGGLESFWSGSSTAQTNAAYAASSATVYIAGNWITKVLKWAGGGYAWDKAKDYVSSKVGVAGSNPPANENDNGGTSFGIGVCNTFGCPSPSSSDSGGSN